WRRRVGVGPALADPCDARRASSCGCPATSSFLQASSTANWAPRACSAVPDQPDGSGQGGDLVQPVEPRSNSPRSRFRRSSTRPGTSSFSESDTGPLDRIDSTGDRTQLAPGRVRELVPDKFLPSGIGISPTIARNGGDLV